MCLKIRHARKPITFRLIKRSFCFQKVQSNIWSSL
eukprot:UN12583